EGNARPKRAREFFRRRADQKSLGDSWKERTQGFDAALLRLAAGDPENILERQQRLFGGVGIGRLGIIDEQDGAEAADLLHAMREPGEGLHAARNLFNAKADRARGGE